MRIRPTITAKQDIAFLYLKDKETNEILFGGGAGGAKTFTGCLWQITRRLKYPETRSVIGRSKLKNLKATTLNTFFEVAIKYCKLKPDVDFRYNASDSTITFYNGSVIYLKDLFLYPSDPLFTSLGGLEITDCFVDEAAEVTEKAINVLNSRIRYKLDQYNLIPKTLLTCNPHKGWLYTQFYKPNYTNTLPKHRKFVKSLVTDNKAISSHYVKQLQKLDKVSRERLLLGNWEYIDNADGLFEYNRLLDLFTNDYIEGGEKFISADIARFGKDKTIICVWNGMRVEQIKVLESNTLTQAAKEITSLALNYRVPRSNIVVDESGIGGGVVDLIKGCKGFVSNARARNNENYQNLKTQCYYKLAELVNNAEIYISDIRHREEIIEELEIIRRDKIDNDFTKLAITKKEKQVLSLGRSPDFADALMMRIYFEIAQTKVVLFK